MKLLRENDHCHRAIARALEPAIRPKHKILRAMLNGSVNLSDPEGVKLYIARKQTWSNGYKILAAYSYNEYAKMKRIHLTIPQYKRDETLPFVPTEEEIDALINGTAKKLSTVLQALKETGFRIGELRARLSAHSHVPDDTERYPKLRIQLRGNKCATYRSGKYAFHRSYSCHVSARFCQILVPFASLLV